MTSIKKIFSLYFVSTKPRTNDFHQVHKEDCPFLPEKEKRIFLGQFDSENEALNEGKSYFRKSEFCRFCMKELQQDKKDLVFAEIEYAANYPVSTIIYQSYEDAMHSYLN
jgi:hypothetical protein